MHIYQLYYYIKPFIPRPIQIFLRKQIASIKKKLYKKTWPVNHKANKKPENWKSWPNNKEFALLITHDVESINGYQKVKHLIDLNKKLGFCTSFNFVPERYKVEKKLINFLVKNGFEIGVHGLNHDGKLFFSKAIFNKRYPKINNYLKEWNSVGFYSPSTIHNLDWLNKLNIEYDSSTYDTDPFEPQSDDAETIFPFWVLDNNNDKNGYLEIPYTLPQDFTLFIILQEKNINIWKEKLDWIAKNNGVAHIRVHPDYMNFDETRLKKYEYSKNYYIEFLEYIKTKYKNKYWNVLPKQLCEFWKKMSEKK